MKQWCWLRALLRALLSCPLQPLGPASTPATPPAPYPQAGGVWGWWSCPLRCRPSRPSLCPACWSLSACLGRCFQLHQLSSSQLAHQLQYGAAVMCSSLPISSLQLPARLAGYVAAFRALHPHRLQPADAMLPEDILNEHLFYNKQVTQPAYASAASSSSSATASPVARPLAVQDQTTIDLSSCHQGGASASSTPASAASTIFSLSSGSAALAANIMANNCLLTATSASMGAIPDSIWRVRSFNMPTAAACTASAPAMSCWTPLHSLSCLGTLSMWCLGIPLDPGGAPTAQQSPAAAAQYSQGPLWGSPTLVLGGVGLWRTASTSAGRQAGRSTSQTHPGLCQGRFSCPCWSDLQASLHAIARLRPDTSSGLAGHRG